MNPRASVKYKTAIIRDTVIIAVCLVVLAFVIHKFLQEKGNPNPSTLSSRSDYADESVVAEVEPEPEPEVEIPVETVVFDDNVMLREDQYQVIPIHLAGELNELNYEYKMTGGPNLDFYLVDEDGLFKWKRIAEGAEESNFLTYSDFGSSRTSQDQHTGTFPVGTYYLIAENMDFGNTAPPFNMEDDIATFQLKVMTTE